MVNLNHLVDTDILIDLLTGQPSAKSLIWDSNLRLYCSKISSKELFAKRGLKNSERRRIIQLLGTLREICVDSTIAAATSDLLQRYKEYPLHQKDALIAATAWVKHLPLLTRNRKHFELIKEIELAEFPNP